jgi:nucleotide-binding universal stress UspA family protein
VIQRILVPLDLSRLSEAKMPVTEAHARAFGAELILLHVLPPSAAPGDSVSAAETQARTFLDAIAARLRSEGIAAEPLLRSGSTADVILAEIAEQRADLVILGSRRPHGLPQRLLSTVQSSVSEEVVARATVPLLLVPPPIPPEPEPAIRSFADDAARAGPVAPRVLGLRTVDMARIVGSVGRAYQLDANFRSRSKSGNDESRFQSILRALRAGEVLPPVELYKLGYGYYVLDGNHRVAAARAIGQREIDAVVTEFVPLKDPQGQRVFAERRIFESLTGLTRVGATREGSYPRLEAMVRAYAAERGIADLREAARDWEAEVFRPMSKLIRRRRLTQRFPGERTADVFVRVADWREQQARTLSGEAAVQAFDASLMEQIQR